MNRYVVCVGVKGDKPGSGWYPRGVQRLAKSLVDVDYRGNAAWWTTKLPPGAKSHERLPYGFKFAAIAEVKRRGADSVLWLDASCWAIRPLDPIWAHLDEHGYLLRDCSHYLSQWSTDRSLAALGLTRDVEFNEKSIPLVTGGMFGMRFSHPTGAALFKRMQELATPEVLCGDWTNDKGQVSVDPRVRGHRHDQVLMGYLAHEMKLTLVKEPKFFMYDLPEHDPSTIFVARGM